MTKSADIKKEMLKMIEENAVLWGKAKARHDDIESTAYKLRVFTLVTALARIGVIVPKTTVQKYVRKGYEPLVGWNLAIHKS